MAIASLILPIFIIIAQGMDMAQAPLPQPAIGDIKLVPYNGDSNLLGFYQVLTFFSNGVDPPGYGGICADDSYREEATVICNQMGYEYMDFAYRNIIGPVWLKAVTCDESNLHILRCQYEVARGSERTDPSTCGPKPNKLLIKCDFSKPLLPYNGTLALCPDDNTTSDPTIRRSVSFGMVGLHFTSHGTWRGLETTALLGTMEANAICRQMGFTGAMPGSAKALSASDSTFNKCFDDTSKDLPFRLHHEAWMKTNDITCSGPQNCFGCCYTYPPLDACTDCVYSNTLIISCTFDPTVARLSTGSAGSKNDCQLSTANTPTRCESEVTSPSCSTKEIHTLRIGLGIVSTLLIIVVIICIVYLCGRRFCSRGNYKTIAGKHDQNDDQN